MATLSVQLVKVMPTEDEELHINRSLHCSQPVSQSVGVSVGWLVKARILLSET